MSRSSSFIRTDKAIMQAFMELLKEKSFEKITVQDILDRTPVTRATFYAHYHDKYEIAERMQQQFLQNRDHVRIELMENPPSKMLSIVRKSFPQNSDIAKALLKIHTEKVDLHRTIVDEFEEFYMCETDQKAQKVEARIYAQARAELQLAHFYGETPIITFERSNEICLNACLHLLRLADDAETREFLLKKLEKKFHLEK